MLQQPAAQFFLQKGDWVELVFEDYSLYSSGFKTSQVDMRAREHPLNCLFVIESANLENKVSKGFLQFNQPFFLKNHLTGRYLSYNQHFATKSELFLRNVLNQNCQFIVKPLYKCQILRHSNLRNGEQCSLAPGSAIYLNQKVGLVVGRDKGKSQNLNISLKKNEQSPLRFIRRNQRQQKRMGLYSLQLYQLKHNQAKSFLSSSKNVITLASQTNNQASYFLIQKMGVDNRDQIQISQQIEVLIRFYSSKQYLGFAQSGHIFTAEQPTRSCSFKLEMYTDETLQPKSPLKIMHVQSGKYLSVHQNELNLQRFSPFNTWLFVAVAQPDLVDSLFLSDTFEALSEIFNSTVPMAKQRTKIRSIFKESINFCYRNSGIYQQFQKLEKVSTVLKWEQQLLFSKIGYLPLLCKFCAKIVGEVREDQKIAVNNLNEKNKVQKELKDQYSEKEQIFNQALLLIVAICQDNKSNLTLFCEEIKTFFEFIGIVKGPCEFLFQLFGFNFTALQILENIEYSYKKTTLKVLEIMLEHLATKQLSISERVKVTRLLRSLLLSEQGSKVFSHEQILLQSLEKKKLANILLALTKTHSAQLLIGVNKKEKIELIELLSQPAYQQQAKLLGQQLRLLVALCQTGSKKHIELFRQVVSQEMIKRYLNQNLESQFLAIFMEILIQIYLNQANKYKNHSLIVVTKSANNAQMLKPSKQNQSPLKSNLLQHELELQNVMLDKTRFLIDLESLKKVKALVLLKLCNNIQAKHLKEDIIVYLLAMRKFVQLQICNADELKDILERLTESMHICLESGVDINHKFIMEYLSLVQYDLNNSLQKAAANLLKKIKNHYNLEFSRVQYSKNIISITNQFLKRQVSPLAVEQTAATLQLIIASCLTAQKSELFLKAAQLYELMIQIGVNFIDKIKKSIPIQSEQSCSLYERAHLLLAKLSKAVSEALYSRVIDQQLSGKRAMLNVLQEICEMLTSGENIEGNINFLAQKIASELCFLERVIDYLCQKKEQLRNDQNNALFRKMFQFISLLLLNSEQNFQQNEDSLVKLQLIYKSIDRGQINLLYELTKSSVAIKRKYSFLFECWIATVKSCFMPRIQVPLSLTLLLQSWSRADQRSKYATELAEILLNDGQFLCSLLKIQNTGQYLSFQVLKRCDYRQEWVFYILLVLRLLRLVLQSTADVKQQLKQRLVSHISLRMLLNLLQESFRLQIKDNPSTILVFLLKQSREQLISLILALYKQNLSQEDMQLVLSYLHKIRAFLSVKYLEQSNNDAIVNMLVSQHNSKNQNEQQKELKEMLVSYICVKLSCQHITADLINTINNPIYLFVNQYYHFCFTFYEAINMQYGYDQNTTQFNGSPMKQNSFLRELNYFISMLISQYKEVIHEKLTYAQFAGNSAAYTAAIKSAEEITRQSINFRHKAAEVEDQIILLEGQQFFQHRELKFQLDSFLGCRHKLQKYLYEAILIILHNRKVQPSVSQRVTKLGQKTKDIIKFIISKLQDAKCNDSTFIAYCGVLPTFLKGSYEREWQPHLQFDEVMVRLSRRKEDRSNQILAVWLQTEYKLMKHYFQGTPTLEERYRKKLRDEDGFEWHFMIVKDRLKGLLQQQRQLYDNKKLLLQAKTYFQQRRLNNSLNQYKLSPELLLRWLQLKLRYVLSNTNRYFDLVLQVILLLKSYCRFIANFDRKYLSQELQSKLTMCLRIIFYAVTGGSMRVQVMLLEYQLWDDLNLILQLDDSLKRQLTEADASTYELIKMLTRDRLEYLPAAYIQGVLQIYNNSVAVYGEQEEAIMALAYPLVRIRSYFQPLKTHAIAILQQFRHCRSAAIQLFSKLDLKALENNVLNTYQKYDYLYQKYTIAVVYPGVQYQGSSNWPIAKHMGFENAVISMGLKLEIQQLNGKVELAQKYAKLRQNLSKQNIKSFLSFFKSFFTDLIFLLLGCCLRWFKRSSQLSNEQIFLFFLARLGRVELQWQERLYNYEFMIYPECKLGWRIKQNCLKQLNFASNQLKRESITTAMNVFVLQYENELNFQTALWKIGPVIFLAQYMRIFRLTCFFLVIILNILLVIDAVQSFNFDGFGGGFPFEIVTVINALLVISMLTVQLIRNVPLSVKLNRYNLEQGLGFLSRGFNSMSPRQQNFIILIKILLESEVAYKIVYAAVACLALYNKLFAALLMLDLICRVSAIQTLILAIWKPRYKILLVVVSFVIMQYFFSILLYFFFRGNVNGHCDTLGHCFEFLFAASFRAINGFVGYLFQEDFNQAALLSLSLFGVFEDIYAIVVHMIMISVMLAVVINSFVTAKAEGSKQKEALSGACIICNIDRSRFNLENRSNFKSHKSIRHNLFNYFDFKYRLNHKQELTSDLERWVQECKSNDWMPDNRAKELEGQADFIRE